jgi:hypothetical protein
MRDFLEGFIKGARETPRVFFAPAIAIWRLLLDTTESLIESGNKNRAKPGEPK